MAINSMTGFGRCVSTIKNITYICEIKTLNSKYLDIFIKIPNKFQQFEPLIIDKTKKLLRRGRIEILIDIEEPKFYTFDNLITNTMLKHYIKLIKKFYTQIQKHNIPKQIFNPNLSINDIILFLEKLDKTLHIQKLYSQANQLEFKTGIIKTFNKALIETIKYREKEGLKIKRFLITHLKKFKSHKQHILTQLNNIQAQIKNNYIKNIKNILSEIDPQSKLQKEKIYTEIAIILSKMDITEELSRISFHEENFLKSIQQNSNTPIGKKLDFICQEIWREINTLSNKLLHTKISSISINLRHIVEEIRQQVQNIE